MLKRSGYVLMELMIVLIIISSLACMIVYPKKNDLSWQQFEMNFNQTFYEVHQTTQLKRRYTQILARDTTIIINDVKLHLPANWQVSKPLYLELYRYSTQGGRVKFVNQRTGIRRQLVFQLGGGTYDWR